MGVIPYFHDIQIAEEDSVSLERRSAMTAQKDYLIDIAVIGLPHISNIDEFDPLRGEPDVRLRYVEANDALGNPDLIILPGSKSTVADLEWLKVRGFAAGIRPLSEDGAAIVGICGGYQMLGSCILDHERVESDIEWSDGLGLLPVTTVFERGKRTDRVRGQVREAVGMLLGARGLPLEGYEIHMGHTFATEKRGGRRGRPMSQGRPREPELKRPIHFWKRSGRPCDQPDGAIDSSGRVLGTYIHGLFHNSGLRRAILQRLAEWKGVDLPHESDLQSQDGLPGRDREYDKLAGLVRDHINLELVYRIAGLRSPAL